MYPPRRDDLVQRGSVDDQVSDQREGLGAERLEDDRLTVAEVAHVQLAGRRPGQGPVRTTVHHQTARSADALAAIALEGNRLDAVVDQPLVQHVERLEQRRVGAHVVHQVRLEPPGFIGAALSPGADRHVHRRELPPQSAAHTGQRCDHPSAPRP
jgi:hypothetical protein